MNIRRVIINNRNEIAQLMLSDSQIGLYRHVLFKKSVSAGDISKELKCSPESASNRLRKLSELGYMDKEFHADNSGGYFFQYSIKDLSK